MRMAMERRSVCICLLLIGVSSAFSGGAACYGLLLHHGDTSGGSHVKSRGEENRRAGQGPEETVAHSQVEILRESGKGWRSFHIPVLHLGMKAAKSD